MQLTWIALLLFTPMGAAELMPEAQQNRLIHKYCAVCHTDTARNGGLTLQHFDAATVDPSLAAMLLSKLTGGASLATVQAVKSDPKAAALINEKMKGGAMGAAGIPIPDQATIDSLIHTLAAEATGAYQWSVSATPSLLREAERNPGESTMYRLILSCNAVTGEGEMQLAWSPQPKSGALMASFDGATPEAYQVEGKESMGNGSKVTAGPASFSFPASSLRLPKRTLRISHLFPGDTVEFPFDSMPAQAHRSLARCFAR